MKKYLLLLFSLFIFILITGCSIKEKDTTDDYEHYDLKGKDLINHSCYDDEGHKCEYALADIAPEKSEMTNYGLFYKLSDDDYILIDTITPGLYAEDVSVFVENRMFLANGEIIEYSLNRENVTKKKLNFYYNDKDISSLVTQIHYIEKGNIYFTILTDDEEGKHIIHVNLECSLSNYKCEKLDDYYFY